LIPGFAASNAVLSFCSTALPLAGWLLQKLMVLALPPAPPPAPLAAVPPPPPAQAPTPTAAALRPVRRSRVVSGHS